MSPVYRFDAFELDSERRELRRAGEAVPIQPRPLDLLLYLARHHERVVPRAELFDTLWNDVQVNDEALSFAVHQARRAVGDDGARQAVIRTVSRNGFRFVARLADAEGQDAEETSASTFVGRAELLGSVEATLREAFGGVRSLLLLRGEAGIGKTRTAEMAAEAAREQGFEVFVAHCVEVEGAPVFWPWIQLLRPMVMSMAPEDLASALGAGGPELARLLPEIREKLPALPVPPPADAKAARFLLFDSVTSLVRRVAEAHPLLLVIDDLHRADVSSLILLRDLTRQLAGTRIVLLGTHREAELSQDPARADRVAELVREEGTRLLALGGLCEEEVGELLRITTGHVSSATVRADLRERTNGNPFFLHQVVHVLQSEDRTQEVENSEHLRFELPRHSQDAIAHQVAALPGEVVDVLEIAAVLGRDFAARPLELVTGSSSDDILSLLDIASQARIIHESAGSRSRYRFAHVLLRDALYQRIAASRRARLHLDVGRALLRMEEDGRPADPPTVAQHFFQAARTGDVSQALEIALRAGRWAEERLAFEEAVGSFEQALDLCDRADAPDQRRRCEILLALGDAHTKSGNRDAARDCFQAVGRLARFKGLPEELAAAALRFAPDFLSIETGVYDAELVSLLKDALAALPSADSAIRARLLGRLAVALHWAPGSEARRRELCEDALAMATRLAEPSTLRYVECAGKLALYSIDDPERYMRADASTPLEGQDAPIVLLEQLLRMTSLLQCGRLEEYGHGIDVFTGLARQLRQPQALWYGDLFRATRASLEGRFAEAELHARRYYSEGERVNDKNVTHSLHTLLYMNAVDRGGLEQLEAPLRQMITEFPQMLGWRCALAMFYAELGHKGRAAGEIDRILDLGLATALKRNEWFGAVGALGLASSEICHRQGAELVHQLAKPHADELLVVGYCSFSWGAVSCLLGVTASTLEEWSAAERYFQKAAALNRDIGALPALARTRFYEGRMLITRGRLDEAAEALDESASLAETLRLPRLRARIEALRTAN